MDFGDASLVAATETMRLQSLFRIDWQFYVYRLSYGGALEVVPY
jgi:hypothetical protein